MTTQVLMSTSVILSEIEASSRHQQSSESGSRASSAQAGPSKPRLPYQATHQVELLHLQAETEALLQHVKALKQQRATSEQLEQEPLKAPALVSR